MFCSLNVMRWNEGRLKETLSELRTRRGDSTRVEVKRAEGGLPENLPTTICAFANMPEGGTIILGVDERSDFSITGVTHPAKMEAALVDQARAVVYPAPGMETAVVVVDGLAVVVMEVVGLSIVDKPAKYKQRAYLRQSDGDYEMADHELRMIEVAKLHVEEQVHYDDQEISGTSVDDVDPEQLQQFLGATREGNRRLRNVTDSELLRLMRVTTSTGALTVAGSYALGFFPQGAKPALSVTAAVQLPRDESRARTRNLAKFTGPVAVLLDDALEWVRSNISSDRVYSSDGNLEIKYEFPLAAVREAIGNALVHRDLGPNTLGMGKGVEIRLTDQALVIISPGGLRGLTVQQLRSVDLAKAAVNQRLYSIVQNLRTSEGAGVIEGEGGGVREIMLATREAEQPAPEFIDSGVQFVVKLWRGSVFTSEEQAWFSKIAPGKVLTYLQKSVLVSLHNGGQWTMSRVLREFTPIEEERALSQISHLVTQEQIILDEEGQISLEGREVETPDDQFLYEELKELGRNVPIIYRVLQGAQSGDPERGIADLVSATGLSLGQVRYALGPLLEKNLITMHGGQGLKSTTYQVK